MHRAYGLGLYTLFVPEALALPVVQDDQCCYLMFNLIIWTKISWAFPKCLAFLGRNFFGFFASAASHAGGKQFEISWTFGECLEFLGFQMSSLLVFPLYSLFGVCLLDFSCGISYIRRFKIRQITLHFLYFFVLQIDGQVIMETESVAMAQLIISVTEVVNWEMTSMRWTSGAISL